MSTPKETKSRFSVDFEYFLLTLFVVMVSIFAFYVVFSARSETAKDEAINLREAAWDARIAQAQTIEERKVLTYARERVLGCKNTAVKTPQPMGWDIEKVKVRVVAYLIEHETQCLVVLQGEALALDRSQVDRLENIRLP